MLFRVVWPYRLYCGSPFDLNASIQRRLIHYSDGPEKIIVFHKYHYVSAKDRERIRRAGESTTKTKNNKPNLACVLSTFNEEENLMMEPRDDAEFGHGEADITMIS